MEFGAVPYLVFYELLFFLWFVKMNRQIMFWLYLWQLKEYHWGRFIDHFTTQKGRSIFFNNLFVLKLIFLAAGLYFVLIPLGSRPMFDFADDFRLRAMMYMGALAAIFGIEALYTAILFFKKRLLHPGLTKKSILLIMAAHTVLYAAGLAVFFLFLGELRFLDFCVAGFWLLLLDVFAPVFISLVVLGLQPLTIIEKNKILKSAAAVISGRPDLLTIGIAGSYGKSVTKEILAHILGHDFGVLKSLANQNTEIGIATRVINDLGPEHRVFVCEIGAVHKGRIRQVAGIVNPRIGILSGINRQHQAVFGSFQNIIDAKYEIIEGLPDTGTAILNWQSQSIRDSFESQKHRIKAQKIVFAGKDIVIADIRAEIESLSFTLAWDGKAVALATNARGAFMVEPITLAVAGAVAAGMAFDRAVEIVNRTDFSPFNIQTSKNAVDINIVSSTYSANPEGVAGHLDYLKLWPGKKCIVMPCLIELGSASKEEHFKIGQKIAQVCDLAIITTRERFGDIKKGAVSAGMDTGNVVFLEKADQLEKKIKNCLREGDVILLEGRLSDGIVEFIKK